MHPLRSLREAGSPTPEQVAKLLAENVVFNSPVLIRAIEGRDAVSFAIANSSRSRDSVGKYVLESKLDARTTFLRWEGTIDGHKLESLEILVDDENGQLVERTIAYRPFPAVQIFRDRMRANAGGKIPDDMWDYPV
ncbi:hypothetical protein FHS55_003266 [Angulomicrobium tetraedrale]|uniref:SnoaL-like domain-containing protein n=1 Tax=Ancylobacter tetraedralis TaxID=217068 RepID=A0A839ZDB2_9HYPH|nr:hypothetical protein [Ancylobacter tetraedralis]MBB3772645.1 hypothetical protein [Ancylobacter tetraedralis]